MTGYCCPIVCNTPGIVNGRHTIMSGPGTDPNTDGAITVVAPDGGGFSARLGNDDVDSEAERLSYTMTVAAENALFVYRYAVVMEDPSHSAVEQPRFEIRMFDGSDAPIDCGIYNVYSTAGIPGFVTITNDEGDVVNYKNWTTVGMDLTAYIGQTVTIEFSTGDCSLGGHYGYAYIDCYCSPLAITSDFCPGSETTTLTAPLGFAQYLWSTGETTSSIEVDAPVTGQQFSCVLTSVTGCTATITATLTPSIVASGYGQVGNCMNAVQFTDNSQVTSGPPINSWTWDFGDNSPTSTEQSPFHEYTAPGDYEVQLIVLSNADCPDTMTQTITVIESPVVDFTYTTPCFGETVSLQDVTPPVTAVVERRWDLGDGSPTIADPTVDHAYAAPGDYDVSLYVEDQNGCHDSLTVTITVYESPVVDLGPDLAACEGETLALDAENPGSEFLWSTGGTGQVLNATTSGTYWAEVTNAGGCATRDSVTLVFNPMPVLSLADVTICISEEVVLDAGNPGCTYAWSNGSTDQTITVSEVSGVHEVTVTTAEGCALVEDAVVTFIEEVAVDLGPDPGPCDGEVVLLDAGAPADAVYLWNTGATTQTVQVTADDTLSVLLTNGYCEARDTVVVLFDPLPTIDLPDTTLCVSSTVTLDAFNPDCTYLWSTTATTPSIVVGTTSGVYSVTVTAANGCSNSDAATVQFIPEVAVELGPDQVWCDGGSTLLDAGFLPATTYAWSTSATTQAITVTDDAFITVAVTNGYCHASDSVDILFNPLPVLTLTDTTLCEELLLTLDAGNPGSTYAWSNGATTRTIVLEDASGPYEVVVTTAENCTDSVEVQVVFIPRIVLELGPDTTLCDREVLLLDATNPDGIYTWTDGTSAATTEVRASADVAVHVTNGWCHGQDSIEVTFIPNPEHVLVTAIDTCFEDPNVVVTLSGHPTGTLFEWSTGEVTREIQIVHDGAYVVFATNLPRCTTVDTVLVREYCPPRVFVPNTFTPNGDGVNDHFAPVGYNVRTDEFLIFDRWGEVIHDSTDPWDGTHNGTPVQDGVYNWRCSYVPLTDLNGGTGTSSLIEGHVNVLR